MPEGPPPTGNRKNWCRKLVLSSRGIYFRRRGRNSRNSYLKIGNNSIFHRDFYQKSQIFLNISFSFFILTRDILHADFLISPLCGNNSSNVDYVEFVYKYSRFSQKFSTIFIRFPIVLLDLSKFC